MFSDPLTIIAAVAGGFLGLWAVLRFGCWRAPRDVAPAAPPRSFPTGYASTHRPSPAPILAALGAALLGVGFALTAADVAFGYAPLVLGAVVGAAAVVSLIRAGRGDVAGPGPDESELDEQPRLE